MEKHRIWISDCDTRIRLSQWRQATVERLDCRWQALRNSTFHCGNRKSITSHRRKTKHFVIKFNSICTFFVAFVAFFLLENHPRWAHHINQFTLDLKHIFTRFFLLMIDLILIHHQFIIFFLFFSLSSLLLLFLLFFSWKVRGLIAKWSERLQCNDKTF